MTNVTVEDALGTVRALAAFLAILLCPGYVVGWATDLFGFRIRLLREQMAWSVALSFAVMPIFVQLAARIVGVGGVAVAAGIFAVAAMAMLVRRWPGLRMPDGYVRKLAGFVAFGGVVLVLELLDFQFGNKLHLGVSTLDQEYRVGFVNAVARGGVPPLNPFYHAGASAALRYYYFWYATCAVAMKVGFVSARQALIASSVGCGVGFVAMIALFMRHFLRVRAGLNRQIMTAALLLCCTGLDLIPVFYKLWAHNDFGGETEWWSPDQVSSWMDTLIWVPNHASSLIACLTVFLLVWRAREELTSRQRMTALGLAGVAAASGFGLSIYVAAGLGMMLAAWGVRESLRERSLRLAGQLLSVAVVAGVLLLPYLRDLLGAASGTEGRTASGPTHVLAFGLRKMLDPAPILARPQLARLAATHPVLLDQGVRLVLLLPGYALELGFFGAALMFAWVDRKRMDDARRTALFLCLTGLAIVSVVRSAVIGNNDFGTRASLLPCFFLLLLSAGVLLDVQDERYPKEKLRGALLAPLLLFGLIGTAFQALALRFYIPIHSSHNAPGFEHLAETALDTRRAYQVADRVVPAGAILQSDPSDQGSYFYIANMLFTPRAMAVDAAVDCGSVFGGDPRMCQPTQNAIRQIFHAAETTAEQAQTLCGRVGIQYLVASRRDPVWGNPAGWVWKLPVITGPATPEASDGGTVRIIQCDTIPQK